MKRTNIHLDEMQIGRLQALADLRGVSVAMLVRNAVDEYLDENAPDEASLMRYKGYVVAMTIDAAAGLIRCRGRGPIGDLTLEACTVKEMRELFHWCVNRHIDYLKTIKERLR